MPAIASSARRAEATAALGARGVGVADYLARLGLEATVQPAPPEAPTRLLNHLVVLVHGLPTSAHPEGTWWAEVGLADGPTEPLALGGEPREDGPYTYRTQPSPVYAGGWRLVRGEGAGAGIVDVDTAPPPCAEVAAGHTRLSTSPESRFVRTATVQRRHARGLDVVRARWLARIERAGTHTTPLAGQDEWFAPLADVFGLDLPDVDVAERRALWARVCAQHDAWVATGPG
jgi:hypothetical protein